MEHTYRAAQEAVHRYQTRDPYELLDCIGVVTRVTQAFEADNLKGFAMIEGRTCYAVINGNLNEHDQRIVAGHEAAHLILHKDEIKQSPGMAMRDFQLYPQSNRLERQANQFLADFMVSDGCVMEAVHFRDLDFQQMASTLYLPPELLNFKLFSMMQRGLPVEPVVDLRSDFLRGGGSP